MKKAFIAAAVSATERNCIGYIAKRGGGGPLVHHTRGRTA